MGYGDIAKRPGATLGTAGNTHDDIHNDHADWMESVQTWLGDQATGPLATLLGSSVVSFAPEYVDRPNSSVSFRPVTNRGIYARLGPFVYYNIYTRFTGNVDAAQGALQIENLPVPVNTDSMLHGAVFLGGVTGYTAGVGLASSSTSLTIRGQATELTVLTPTGTGNSATIELAGVCVAL